MSLAWTVLFKIWRPALASNTESHLLDATVRIRRVACDPVSAYERRLRLRRELLSVLRVVADRFGLVRPDLPRPLTSSIAAEPSAVPLIDCCNRLTLAIGRLCQPSEELDACWISGWNRVTQELDELDALISALSGPNA